jgi:hypothetical protein
MSTPTALAGAATTVVLVGALGNPGAVDAAQDADERALGLVLTRFVSWDVADLPGDAVGGVVLRLGSTIALVALLSGLAGRSRSRAAAFIGGWGALAVAAAVAGGVAYVYQVAVVLDGRTLSTSYLDGLVQAVDVGASFGVWTGWLVGLAVALATRRAVRSATAARGAGPRSTETHPGRRLAEPPLPWWAPTPAGDGEVRPGPTVFLPGGAPAAAGDQGPTGAAPASPVARPVQSEPAHEMTTVSGDPHPSDPDATQPVGLVAPAAAALAGPGAGADADRPRADADDADDDAVAADDDAADVSPMPAAARPDRDAATARSSTGSGSDAADDEATAVHPGGADPTAPLPRAPD